MNLTNILSKLQKNDATGKLSLCKALQKSQAGYIEIYYIYWGEVKWERYKVSEIWSQIRDAGPQTYIMNTEQVTWGHTSDLQTGKKKSRVIRGEIQECMESLMLNSNWILNLKDTNKIQQQWRGEGPLICALRYCSQRSQSLWPRWGWRSITRRKWTLTLILISAGLEQISLHLSPYRRLSQTTTPS